MNENNNRVNSTLPASVYQHVIAQLDDIQQQLQPYMAGLTAEERKTLPKISVDNKVFVQAAIKEMAKPGASVFVPAFFNAAQAQAQTDLDLYEQLDTVSRRLTGIAEVVEGTRILAGSEAFTSGLAFKRLAEAAAASGVPGADAIAQTLRERFASHGRTAEPDAVQ